MFNKYILKSTVCIGILLGTSACEKFIDRDPLSQASETTYWKSENDALVGLNAVYTALPTARDFWRDCQSDNSAMTNAWGEGGLGYISMGNQNAATGYIAEEWRYDDVRKCLYFLERLRGMNFDQAKKNRFEAEARFILSMKYLRMVQHFGNIPLIKESPVTISESSLPRANKEEVLAYALENAQFAIDHLPARFTGADLGRVNKAAAYLLKANIYLYQASIKQFHENVSAATLWQQAYEAAAEVQKMGYSLVDDYAEVFKQANNANTTEVILARQYVEDKITHMTPVLASPSGTGITGNGWASFCPTRDLVDSYLCTDGKGIRQSSMYDPANPWEKRDLRLKKTFMLAGVPVLRPNGQYVAYQPHPAYNKSEKINSEGGGITGFMYLKFNEPEYAKPDQGFANWPIYRYAEALLIVAEALNEFRPGDALIKTALDQVRKRAGLPAVTAAELGSQMTMRQLIREERRHEFVAEHKRYFDILRWKIAEDVLSKPAEGINSNQNDAIGDWTKPRFLAQKRVFDKNKHYLWPIPQNAIDRNKNLLPQNPGW
ncbi:RagB/SusD family nutrient uptake outer membrane protein [Sphingobacterium ginsenosidimutans]|uniref:RagB/SusD family nutrient uptake outer membrane protein n=1 Tax=Sphingobacterium ginsenosidimutans TaxID=687845 RepID=A0ABP7ZWX3_9SPHI